MPEQTAETTSLGLMANLFTPGAVIMLTFAILIDGGEHFMIVDKADLISDLINQYVAKQLQ